MRGKKDKLSENSQADSGSISANVEELQSDSELEQRVKRWLSESSLPKDSRSRASCYTRQNQDCYFDAGHQMDDGSMSDVEKADTGVIYHPDFADWASIHPTQGERTPSPENLRPDDLLQVLDDATASLSKLLSAPFG